ncbi:hypothetical protein PUN28_015457 [Cardiocondyla obscurior]|uniref:Uncharacterized protein n=1 Tax=Cardiocondyla obscurior TaxID=286306 RepID=A0AAW2ET60_9HYME
MKTQRGPVSENNGKRRKTRALRIENADVMNGARRSSVSAQTGRISRHVTEDLPLSSRKLARGEKNLGDNVISRDNGEEKKKREREKKEKNYRFHYSWINLTQRVIFVRNINSRPFIAEPDISREATTIFFDFQRRCFSRRGVFAASENLPPIRE